MLSDLVAALRAWADGAGAIGVFAVSLFDSALLALPNATDALILYLTVQQPGRWWVFAGAALAGAVVGTLPIYWIGRRGGQALLDRRFAGARTARAVSWYRRSAFGAIMVPAFLPPPVPFKIFALLAGATGLPLARFLAAMTIGRGTRHVIEALLALTFRHQAVAVFERHGARIGLVALGVVSAVIVGTWWRRRGTPRT